MIIYNYHAVTGEYLGQSQARVDPLETAKSADSTVYLTPANATSVSPPDVVDGYVAIWSDDGWTHIEDHRGSEGWVDGAPVTIEDLGPLPDGFSEAAPAQAGPSEADVQRERARRLSLGFDYDFGDDRGVHRIGTTDADMAGWDEVSTIAQALINSGSGSTVINIVTDTGPVMVTAVEWQSVLITAAAFRQPIWAASFALQAMDPIPADFTDDSYWTVS